jgi:PAS domain S-box-containing protein
MAALELATRHSVLLSPDPLFVCSLPDIVVVLASHSAGLLLGREPGQLTGLPLRDCLGLDRPLDVVEGQASSIQHRRLTRPGQPSLAVEVHLHAVPELLLLVRVQPSGRGVLEHMAAHLPVALRGHDAAGEALFANPAAANLPPGPLPPGDLAHAGRVWQVERVSLGNLDVNAATDVTSRERAAGLDRERLSQVTLLLNTTEEFVGLVGVNEERLFVNPAFCRATGYSPEEVVTTDFRQRVHPDDLELVEQTRQANLRGERTHIEYRCRRKDGSYLWLDLRATPLPGPDGKIAWIAWTSRDVSERKRLEQELRDSRRLVEHLADVVPHMLAIYDLVENRYIWVSAQSRAVRGYSPGELLRMEPGQTQEHVHPEDRLETEEVIRRLLANPEGQVVQMRYRVQHPERGWRTLLTRCLVFRHTPDGRPWQVLAASEDVTEQPSP